MPLLYNYMQCSCSRFSVSSTLHTAIAHLITVLCAKHHWSSGATLPFQYFNYMSDCICNAELGFEIVKGLLRAKFRAIF